MGLPRIDFRVRISKNALSAISRERVANLMEISLAARRVQLARALADLNAGNEGAAREICASLLREAADDPAVHQLMATIALRVGRLPEAEQHVAISLQNRPQHLPTWLLAGQIAQAAGDLRLAAQRLDRAVTLDPAREDAAFARCRIWIALANSGQFDAEAHPDHTGLIADLLSRFPDFAPGWAAIGSDMERIGQLDAALVATTRAAKAAPSVAANLKSAELALRLARPSEAADVLQRALALDPTMAPVWFKLGVILQDCRQADRAIAAYRQALALDPTLSEAATNLGIVLQETGDLAAAKRAYGQALRARIESFGRISQALTAAPKGELWMDLSALRAHLLAS